MALAEYRRFINRDLPIEEKACTSKARFLSRGEARALIRRGWGRGAAGGLRPYRCRYCGWWHLGHHH